MTTDPAVTAAAEAIRHAEFDAKAPWEVVEARAAVAAARPIIEAEVRERIAADIEALPLALYGDRVTLTPARIRQDAARIARGQS